MGEDRARDEGAGDLSRRPRRKHAPSFKAKLAIQALADGKTNAEIAQPLDVRPNQVTAWRRQLMERAADVFGGTVALEASADSGGRQPLLGSPLGLPQIDQQRKTGRGISAATR